MWRIVLHPYFLIGALIAGVLVYNAWKYSRLRRKVSELHPHQKLSIVMQVLRILSLLFRRF